MTDYDELVQIIQYLLNNRFAPKPDFLHGVLGDGLGNVVVPNREDYVYVRFSRGASESFEAFNREAPAINDLPVLIGRKYEDLGLTQIVGIDWSAYIEAGWDDGYAGVALHADSHEWPDGHAGQDVMDVYTRSIVPLRSYVVGSGTSTVYVNAMEYEPSGTLWGGLPGVDLSAPMGAMVTGTARYMGIYLDPGLNALGVVTGATTVFSEAIPIPRPVFPLGTIPSSRVRLYGGQASLTDRDIVDARRLFMSLPTGTSDGFPIGPAGGDLTGSYPDPRVAGLFGYSLLDVAPAQGDRLYYTGGAWRPSPSPISFDGPAGGDLTGSYPEPLVARLFGTPLLDTAPAQGDVLYFTGSAWRPAAFQGGGGWPLSNVWTVDSTDPDADYSTITLAIAGASTGDVILINAETFAEHVTVNKAVTLVGSGDWDTKITRATSPTVEVTADGASLVNLYIENTNTSAASKALNVTHDCTLIRVKTTNNSALNAYSVHFNSSPTASTHDCDFENTATGSIAAYIQNTSDIMIEDGRLYGHTADIALYSGAAVELRGATLANAGIFTSGEVPSGWYNDSSGDLHTLGDEAGIGQRRDSFIAATDHFDYEDAVTNHGWTGWAAYPNFQTPGTVSVTTLDSMLMTGNFGAANRKAFLYRALISTGSQFIVAAPSVAPAGFAIGVRLDDGTDTNWIEYVIVMGAAVPQSYTPTVRDSGGGSVAGSAISLALPPLLYAQAGGTPWSNWQVAGFLYMPWAIATNLLQGVISGLAWTPARMGIIIDQGAAAPASYHLAVIDMWRGE